MVLRNHPKAVIFDIGDLLFTWSPVTHLPVPTMRTILSSAIWKEYECGRVDQTVCYHNIAQQFMIPASDIAKAFSQARDSLQPNYAVISFIQELQKAFVVKIYAMSNISKEDFAFISAKMAEWRIFTRIFTSGHSGMRKPDLSFYRHVLEEIKLGPKEVIFIDDKAENVLAASSLGISCIVFVDNPSIVKMLSNSFDSPIDRGYRFLRAKADFNSITNTGVMVPENFAKLLILDAMQDR